MEEHLDTPEEFSLVKRAKSFTHAGRGLYLFVKTTQNAWVHLVVLLIQADCEHRTEAVELHEQFGYPKPVCLFGSQMDIMKTCI